MTSNAEQPLVSVGLPVYDRPRLLYRALECLTKQTYQNLEIIIADDCSPGEETRKVVRQFMEKDPRIQYIRHERNLGAYLNHLFVFEEARGEYFFWASEDDEWDQRYVEACVGVLTNDKKYGLVFTRYKVVSQDDELNFHLNHNRYLRSKYRKLLFLLLDECLTHKANMFHGIWRKETLERVMERAVSCDLTVEDVGRGYDQAFLLLTLEATDVYQVQEVLFTKRYMDCVIPGSRRELLGSASRNVRRAMRHPISYLMHVVTDTRHYMEVVKRVYNEPGSRLAGLIFFAKRVTHVALRHVF